MIATSATSQNLKKRKQKYQNTKTQWLGKKGSRVIQDYVVSNLKFL